MLLNSEFVRMVAHEQHLDRYRASEQRRLVASVTQRRRMFQRNALRLAHVFDRLSARLLQYAQIEQPMPQVNISKAGRS